jgi:hypothetical protein
MPGQDRFILNPRLHETDSALWAFSWSFDACLRLALMLCLEATQNLRVVSWAPHSVRIEQGDLRSQP